MDIEIKDFMQILDQSMNKKVRYRIDGEKNFVNSQLIGYSFDNDRITIETSEADIVNKDVTKISCTPYEDRVDFWLYGKKTNRFNIEK